MIYGITGSRQLKNAQLIFNTINHMPPKSVVVTGGCVGVDAYAAQCAKAAGFYVITILPADKKLVDPYWESNCNTVEDDGLDYRQRNERIVEICRTLIAFPIHPEDDGASIRSGTWMTVRIARRKRRIWTVYMQ